MSKDKIKIEKETKLVVGEVVSNFVKEEQVELTQEEEIEKFKLKKEKLYNLTQEELKIKEEKEKEEEEELKKMKAELLKSLRERIPLIEKRIYGGKESTMKKSGLKVKESKEIDIEKINKKDENLQEKNNGFERGE